MRRRRFGRIGLVDMVKKSCCVVVGGFCIFAAFSVGHFLHVTLKKCFYIFIYYILYSIKKLAFLFTLLFLFFLVISRVNPILKLLV